MQAVAFDQVVEKCGGLVLEIHRCTLNDKAAKGCANVVCVLYGVFGGAPE